jgi:uncharacterized protein YdaU (DUF1376 family)
MGRAWMPLYVGDYLRDTRDLNTLQHGAYLLLIMHYWQHGALPGDDARLAAITGLSVAQWRRVREPVQAKFADGWKQKRIEAELAKVDWAFMQRRLAGRNGGIKSGIARAVAQGEAIIRAQAEGKRALARNPSGREADRPAPPGDPRTNHNHNFSSSPSSPSSLRSSSSSEGRIAPPQRPGPMAPQPNELVGAAAKPAPIKPANQWSRHELDALFARRIAGAGDAHAEAPAPILIEATSNKQAGGSQP